MGTQPVQDDCKCVQETTVSELHFLRPWWLIALIPLLFLIWQFWNNRPHSQSWEKVCDSELLEHLLLNKAKKQGNLFFRLMLAAAFLTIIALAGPAWKQIPKPLFKNHYPLVFCLDLSRSMLADDLKPNRLVRARLKIEDILHTRTEGEVGLVVFAGEAFTVMPLSSDHGGIRNLLSTLEPVLMPVQGSDVGQALDMSRTLLQRTGRLNGTVLLLTDEEQPEYGMDAARRLAKAGYQLEILGLATPEGAPVPMDDGGFFTESNGARALARLNEPGLQKLAQAGGGQYTRVLIDDSDFTLLLEEENAHRLNQAEQLTDHMGKRWHEEGVWLLIPIALLCSLAFRRGWLLVLALVIFTPFYEAKALEWDDLWVNKNQQAYSSFIAGNYIDAAKKFTDPRWQAAAFHRLDGFDQALAYLPAETGDDWYNRGNNLALSDRFMEAIQAYDQALKINPDDQEARENRAVVVKILAQQQKSRNEQTSKQKDGMQIDNSGQQPQQGEMGRDNQQKKDTDGKKPGENTPSDSLKEKEQQGEGGATEPEQQGEEENQQNTGQTAESETDHQSDEEQELQELLQQIPDDPGGLMRRKFLQQYQARDKQNKGKRQW